MDSVEQRNEGLTVEADATPQQAPQQSEAIHNADLVVGILAELGRDAIVQMCDALRGLSAPLRIAVLQTDGPNRSVSAATEPASGGASVFFVPLQLTKLDNQPSLTSNVSANYQAIFAAAEQFEARGCCLIASRLEASTSQWAWQLAQPLFENEMDLVLPHYSRRKFEGLLNSSIIAPLIRALYGKRINNPMGPDLAVSRRLFQKMLAKSGAPNNLHPLHPLASLTPTALCSNLQVMEVHFGSRIYRPTDWKNMSSVLADVLTPVFLDMERNAPCWQRSRFSVPVAALGEPVAAEQDAGSVDIAQMVESFQLGNRELQEIWGLVLPPTTLFELKKLSRLPIEQFRMADELWVKIVYDFALAHRLRTLSRDHLLRSLTPLYLGWVASYAHDLNSIGISPQRRLERLSIAYESGKSYLVSRWRWPDRFNP
jgi:glucosylglycerate synthase